EASDLSAVALDMERVSPFHRRVYQVARTIPPGATLSYGDIAAHLGARGLARAVGQALGRNPFAIVVPCHRVLAAGGKAGGFSANGGITTKLRLLSLEGAHANRQPELVDADGALGFDPNVPIELLRVSDEKLRGAGLSGAKLLALRDLARRAKRGENPTLTEVHRMEDDAIVERLTQVRGIVRWTVEMLLIFRLGRPDVLPADDYG